ncbi:MAG TPA: hypothetical protein ENK25_05095 [Bacteroidetes bacterium]|nr:hypothetical protein [Bacteroidota bacterium]
MKSDMNFPSVFGTFKEALVITFFVLIILLIVEYIHVQTQGRWSRSFQNKEWFQIILSGLLGSTPGCIGAYTVVSLYTHGLVGFAALVTTMIATFGDEAFVILAMIPETGLILIGVTFLIGILVGFIIFYFEKKNKKVYFQARGHLELHKGEDVKCKCLHIRTLKQFYSNISFDRAILLTVIILFFVFMLTGDIGPETWNWVKVTFVLLLAITIFIIATVPEHFISQHLWKHVIRKHLLRIFLWTWGTFLFLLVLNQFLDINHWIHTNPVYMMALSIMVGIIPESGPHLIFITLFAQGQIPFSILMANSIVQDGHGMLPLLAESRKQFIYVKLINMVAGAIFGYTALAIGI